MAASPVALRTVDLLIDNIGQLITCAGDGQPKRGQALGELGIIPDGAVAVDGGQIRAVGPAVSLRERFRPTQRIDAGGRAVCPGFVDCHTHALFGGDRMAEFEMRLRGATYMEIMAAGGGILNTVAQTRRASVADLVAAARPRLDQMLAEGTTTAEIKSGYGLNPSAELAMLQAMAELAGSHPMGIVPTLLAAHTLPPEFDGNPAGYVAQIVDEIIPQAGAWYASSPFAEEGIPFFCDVFVEDHAFDVAQARQVLTAGLAHSLRPKLHVDQFTSMGGVALAVEMAATSADHLEVITPADVARLADAQTMAVLLSAVNFNLGLSHFAPGRALIDAGAAIALATDLNPGSAPCFSMPLVMALATRYLGLSPAEALNSATYNAAHALGLGHRIGSLEPGKAADLLLLHGDDYRLLSYWLGGHPINRVMKGGEWVIGEVGDWVIR